MARRKELKGVCRELLDTFASRNNDLDGYWAFGKIQTHFQETETQKLTFNLLTEKPGEASEVFAELTDTYARSLFHILGARHIPAYWVARAVIEVEANSNLELHCVVRLQTDLGREFSAEKRVSALPHGAFFKGRRVA